MEKINSRRLPESALNERRRRAVKMREAGVTVRLTARQCEMSTHTVVEAHKAFFAAAAGVPSTSIGWAAQPALAAC